ncbi:retinol dehydrogenase 7-like [Gastrophryne carolinensis]
MWLPLLVMLSLALLYRWYRQSLIMEHLTDKYVFITGCDTGFGNLLAKQLDGHGMKVLAACFTDTGAENLKKETSDRLQTVILDVTDSTSVISAAKWVSFVVKDKGLWGLVNNAGISLPSSSNEWLTKEDFLKILNVNLLGVVDVTLNLLPLIRKARGRVVNISGVGGRLTTCGGGYCMSKYGVESFSDSLRREMCPFGVKVCIIEPGYYTTQTDEKLQKESMLHCWKKASEEVQKVYGGEFFGVSIAVESMWLPLLVLLGLFLIYRWYRQSLILDNLTDKYVFITGCDTGFGNIAAKQLDKRGMKVLASCLTDKGADELKKECSSRLQTVILDITDSKNVSSVCKWVADIVGDKGLWGLVNNSGILIPMAPNEWLNRDDFRKILEVNILGMVDVTISLLPLIRHAQGRIVNVSSIAGRLALCGGGYCISKFGVEAFSDSLRRELKHFGVKVSIINPDFFRTSILNAQRLKDSLTEKWNKLPQKVQNDYSKKSYDTYCNFIDKLANLTNTKLTVVTDCMEHALTAMYPWTRYAAGWYSKLFYCPLSYLPTPVADYFLDA